MPSDSKSIDPGSDAAVPVPAESPAGSLPGGRPVSVLTPKPSEPNMSANISESASGKVPDAESPANPRPGSGNRRVLTMGKPLRLGELAIEKSIQGVAFVSLLFITLIFIFIFKEAIPLFGSGINKAESHATVEASETYGEDAAAPSKPEAPELAQKASHFTPAELGGKTWQPVSLDPKFGLLPLFLGSLKVTLIALLIAGPMGIFAALYTSNFAPMWAREGMKPVIEILAGFPSVVIGFFALVIMASVLQNLFGFEYRLNAFVGGVAMALAVVPIIYTVSEDALAAVPKVMTEASLALGATKWETALFVILPSATPGIFAALILGFGRAFGETMIVLMATGNAALFTPHIFEPVRTLSATIGAEMAEVVFGDIHYRVLFFVGALLFIISFGLNATAEFFVRTRLMKRFKGA